VSFPAYERVHRQSDDTTGGRPPRRGPIGLGRTRQDDPDLARAYLARPPHPR